MTWCLEKWSERKELKTKKSAVKREYRKVTKQNTASSSFWKLFSVGHFAGFALQRNAKGEKFGNRPRYREHHTTHFGSTLWIIYADVFNQATHAHTVRWVECWGVVTGELWTISSACAGEPRGRFQFLKIFGADTCAWRTLSIVLLLRIFLEWSCSSPRSGIHQYASKEGGTPLSRFVLIPLDSDDAGWLARMRWINFEVDLSFSEEPYGIKGGFLGFCYAKLTLKGGIFWTLSEGMKFNFYDNASGNEELKLNRMDLR